MRPALIKNFLWYSLGNGASMIFTLATHFYLARVLRPEGFGKIAYAMTWSNYLTLVADLGVSTYGMREVARQPSRIADYLKKYLSIRWSFSVAVLTLFTAVVWTIPTSMETKLLLTGFALLLLPRALAVDWALQGLERMSQSGLSRALAAALPLCLIFIWARNPEAAIRIPGLFFIGLLATHLTYLFALRWSPGRLWPTKKEILDHARKSFSFWLLTVVGSAYFGTVDTITLSALTTHEQVGHYAAAFKAMSVIQVVVAWLGSAAFPSLSNLGRSDGKAFRAQRRHFMKLSLLLGTGLMILGWMVARPAIQLVFGPEYMQSVPLFRILVILVVLGGVNGPYSQPLLALGHERAVLGTVLLTAILHAILCLLCIPRWGAAGAAWATVAAYGFGTALVMLLYSRKVHFST